MAEIREATGLTPVKSPHTMTKAHTLHRPGAVLHAPLKVPDFPAMLEQFARTEVAHHQFRKARCQPTSLRIPAIARKAVAVATLQEKDRPAKGDDFERAR